MSVPLTNAEVARARQIEGLRRDFGPECLAYLADPNVIELMLNPDGRLWIDRLAGGMVDTGLLMPRAQAERLMTSVANLLDTVVTRDQPILEGELALDSSRFEGIYPPIVVNPCFAIRKKASRVFAIEDYEANEILTHLHDETNLATRREASFFDHCQGKSHGDIIRHAVLTRKNILVVGGTSSGKTTLVNAIIDAIVKLTPEHRLVIIEDTGEIQCNAKNNIVMRCSKNTGMTELLAATLRLRPDRIGVGEVRGPAALALLKMWNTGHPGGFATIHADDCVGGLVRMQRLIEENPGVRANEHEIAEAIDMCIFIGKNTSSKTGRKVSEIVLVEGYDEKAKKYILKQV